MPYTRTLVDGGKGLLKTGVGVVTGEEVLAVSRHDADNEDEIRNLIYGMVDFSATTSLKLTSSHMRQVAEANRRLALIDPGRRGIVAIVAPSDMSFGTARVWHTLSEDFGWKRDIFRDRASAMAWLRATVPSGDDPVAFPTLNPAPASR
jgi:hypothetical protein